MTLDRPENVSEATWDAMTPPQKWQTILSDFVGASLSAGQSLLSCDRCTYARVTFRFTGNWMTRSQFRSRAGALPSGATDTGDNEIEWIVK